MTEFGSGLPAYVSAARRLSTIDDDGAFPGGDLPEADERLESSDRDDDALPPRREGLPAAFRMRHDPHYVEAMFGARPAPSPGATSAPGGSPFAAAASAIVDALDTVARVIETLPRRGRPLHDRVALDLVRAEAARARRVADAVAVLQADILPALDDVDLVGVVSRVLDELGVEDRLLGLGPTPAPHGTCRVFGDPDLLTTAIGAVLTATRALAATRGDSERLGVSLGPAAGGLRELRVEQWAVRLPAAVRDRLFEPGWSGHPAGPTGGLLLAAARTIAAAQGGDLVAETLDRGGCAFILRLPAAD